MTHIATLVFDRVAIARLRQAAGTHASLRACASGDELVQVVRHEPVSLIVVEPWDEARVPASQLVERIRARHPTIPIVAYCTRDPASIRELINLAQAGIGGVVLREDDEPSTLRGILETARDNSAASQVFLALAPQVPDSLRSLVWHCVRDARLNLTVTSLADSLRINRKTLVRRLAKESWPGPRELLTWSRLLVAVLSLQDEDRSVEQIALWLDFPSATAFRNTLRRHVGLRPQDVRARGGVTCVLRAFERSLARRRPSSDRSSLSHYETTVPHGVIAVSGS